MLTFFIFYFIYNIYSLCEYPNRNLWFYFLFYSLYHLWNWILVLHLDFFWFWQGKTDWRIRRRRTKKYINIVFQFDSFSHFVIVNSSQPVQIPMYIDLIIILYTLTICFWILRIEFGLSTKQSLANWAFSYELIASK